jgi:hypothetical protein
VKSSLPCYDLRVSPHSKFNRFAAMGLLLLIAMIACRKQEQAVVGVAKGAVNAEQQMKASAQAKASTRDQQRATLSRISLPTKSLYVDVHDPSAWANPFLSVRADALNLRIVLADANPSPVGEGSMLRPEAARRQEVQLRPEDLDEAIAALPAGAWKYGRVIAIAEASGVSAKDRPKMRRNLENAIKQLNDLGIVVQEWPTR